MRIPKKNQPVLLFILFCSFYFNESFSDELIKNSVVNIHRSEENRKRDVYRNPQETLIFFGIKKDMNVLEILPGKGYYTEILGNFLKDNGKLTVASFGEKIRKKNEVLRSIHNNFQEYFSRNKDLFGEINIKSFNSNGILNEMPDSSFDMVLTFRNTHNWIRMGVEKKVYRAIHRLLKKGGVLGIVQHRGEDLHNHVDTAKKGYVPEKYLINLIKELDFEFISKSEINSNSLDIKNYKEGVWTLPPTLRLKDVNRKKYLAIGESDRMTLKFEKK